MPKIKLFCSSGFACGDHEDEMEVDDAEWDAMPEAEREEFLNDAAITHRDNHIDCGAWVIEDSDS